MEKITCPLCGTEDYTIVLRARDRVSNRPEEFQLVRCLACALCYINPRPCASLLAEFYFDEYEPHVDRGHKRRKGPRLKIRLLKESVERAVLRHYFGYPPPKKRAEFHKKMAMFPFYLRFKLNERNRKRLPYRGDGSILDIGCGTGRFLEWMQDHGWKTRGIDNSPAATEKARAKGLSVDTGDILYIDHYASASFDVVTMWDVVEHLSAPLETLDKIHSLLKPGGLLVVGTPNIDSLPAKLFGRDWFPLEIPRHLVNYSPQTLRQAVAKVGFVVEKITFSRRNTTILKSVDYLPDGTAKFFCQILRVKWIRKLAGTILALCHKSEEMTLYATRG